MNLITKVFKKYQWIIGFTITWLGDIICDKYAVRAFDI